MVTSGYSVASFNSTIPTGSKAIETLGGDILRQMRSIGEQPDALPTRDVYYLVRGRKRGHVKVCLTHGSFFETIPTTELIREAFLKVLDDRLTELDQETKASIAAVFTEREAFSQTRDVGYIRQTPFSIGVLKHPFNGRFLVLQCPLI